MYRISSRQPVVNQRKRDFWAIRLWCWRRRKNRRGTSAVLRGKQAAFEILEDLGKRYNYNDFLRISKEYIDSQQHPTRIIEKPYMPSTERMKKPFVMIDCLYGFACNPCAFACPHGAITKTSSSTVPQIDYNKCIGCMICVTMCPGLAIFGYNV